MTASRPHSRERPRDPSKSLHRTIKVMKRLRDSDDQVSDEALLSGIALGDEDAMLLFVRRYQRRLFGLALGIVGDLGSAEDVAQEAFIRILRHAAVFGVTRLGEHVGPHHHA